MKRNISNFVIRIVGAGINPRAVPMRALTRVLNAVQRLIEHTEEEPIEREEGIGEEPVLKAPLHLIKISKGSAVYSVVCDSEDALQTIAETGRYLRDPIHSDWYPEILSPIEDLSAVAKALNCEIEFGRPGEKGEILAKITSYSYYTMSEMAFVTSESTLSGYLERVGGAIKMHCGLRLPDQQSKMVICPVATEDLIRELGHHVYENVRVSGAVTWFRRNWRVKSIFVKSFEPSKEGSILQALEHIYEVGGKDWDKVEDVDGAISEMRGT